MMMFFLCFVTIFLEFNGSVFFKSLIECIARCKYATEFRVGK